MLLYPAHWSSYSLQIQHDNYSCYLSLLAAQSYYMSIVSTQDSCIGLTSLTCTLGTLATIVLFMIPTIWSTHYIHNLECFKLRHTCLLTFLILLVGSFYKTICLWLSGYRAKEVKIFIYLQLLMTSLPILYYYYYSFLFFFIINIFNRCVSFYVFFKCLIRRRLNEPWHKKAVGPFRVTKKLTDQPFLGSEPVLLVCSNCRVVRIAEWENKQKLNKRWRHHNSCAVEVII